MTTQHANTPENRRNVRVDWHVTVRCYPHDWFNCREYANFTNARGQLCGFVEVDGGPGVGKYLTSTVY